MRSIEHRIALLESRMPRPTDPDAEGMRRLLALLTDEQLDEMIEHLAAYDEGRAPRPLSFTWPPAGVLAHA